MSPFGHTLANHFLPRFLQKLGLPRVEATYQDLDGRPIRARLGNEVRAILWRTPGNVSEVAELLARVKLALPTFTSSM